MPFILRDTQQSCDDFMSRPGTHHCRFPTGRDFYFSLPFDKDWLRSLRPQELAYLIDHLDGLLIPFMKHTNGLLLPMAKIGSSDVDNVLESFGNVSHILNQIKDLPCVWVAAWENGHGYPEYDYCQWIVGFRMDWGIQTLVWKQNGNKAVEYRKNGVAESFHIYGGAFKSVRDWAAFSASLQEGEMDALDRGYFVIQEDPAGGEIIVPNPRKQKPDSINKKASAILDEAYSHRQPVCITFAPPQTIHMQGSTTKVQEDAAESKALGASFSHQTIVGRIAPGRIITADASGRAVSERVLQEHHENPYGNYVRETIQQPSRIKIRQVPSQVTIRQSPAPQNLPPQTRDRTNPSTTRRHIAQTRASRSRSAQTHQVDKGSSTSRRSKPVPGTSSITAVNSGSNGSSPPRSSDEAAYQAHAYQAYAEDSAEDSAVELPGPAPGSWRDV